MLFADVAHPHHEDRHGERAVGHSQHGQEANERVELVRMDLEEASDELPHLPSDVAVI